MSTNLINASFHLSYSRSEEILTWLLEVVEDGEDLWDGGRVVWSAQYYTQGKPHHHHHHHRAVVEETNKKITARLEIQKDDIQSVLPISKVSNYTELRVELIFGDYRTGK